jgi:hypothetical protein
MPKTYAYYDPHKLLQEHIKTRGENYQTDDGVYITAFLDYRKRRIDRLEFGNQQFGHAGSHYGTGTANCPLRPHHHCDAFCELPDINEIIMAGLDVRTFRPKSRR